MSGPLEGYRVVELTSTVSGPFAGMMLSDQGADVIKVEPPGIGDLARFMGTTRSGMAAMFSVLNRNKRSVVLDFKVNKDFEILKNLLTTADVLIENYRPGVVKKLGLDYESIKKINPNIIYTSISGYGQSGPYINRRVYDPLIQATAGAAASQNADNPEYYKTIVFDKVTGLTAAQSVSTALLHRERTGEGQYLPISMLDSALYYIWPDVMWSKTWLGEGIDYKPDLFESFPLFKAKDKPICVILVADNDFKNLVVFAVNMEQPNTTKTKKFFTDLNIQKLDIFFDSNLNFVKEFKLRGIPTTVLINKKGEEFARIVGSVDFQDQKLLKWLSNYD